MDAYSRRSSSSTAAATRSPGGVNSNKPTGSCSVVAAGSVWETRMRSDEVKGGIKVFNGGEPEADHNNQNNAVPGKFWVRRFRDAWDSCSHKKAVAFSIFTLVWNLSSVVARIWAAFMLFVAFRYYQQSLVQPDDWEKDDGGAEATWHGRAGGPRRGRGPTIVEPTKEKKASEV
ncbi:hypothetical protein CRG98_027265 [Punica granatum]|uniref:Reticulon-like protein n=1 Tax=Punica granatum TaxID=22663 RepID=A0A2I0J7X6_PUNGR|nr:hypothetical protein CRG98_027265 [Punica granatum]